MSQLKIILNISSFSEIVGESQPSETCPMIDSHIGDLNKEIDSWKEEISGYEEAISQEESEEEPSDHSIKSYQNSIDKLSDKIETNTSLIQDLEDDRKTISSLRKEGVALRSHILDLLDKSLKFYNGQYFLFTNQLNKESSNYSRSSINYLKTTYRDVDKNYERLISWILAWDDCKDAFLNSFPSSVIQIEKDLDESDDFFISVIALEKLLQGIEDLTVNQFNQTQHIFSDCLYSGPAFFSFNAQNQELALASKTQIEPTDILIESSFGLNLYLLWEKYLPYIDKQCKDLLISKNA